MERNVTVIIEYRAHAPDSKEEKKEKKRKSNNNNTWSWTRGCQ